MENILFALSGVKQNSLMISLMRLAIVTHILQMCPICQICWLPLQACDVHAWAIKLIINWDCRVFEDPVFEDGYFAYLNLLMLQAFWSNPSAINHISKCPNEPHETVSRNSKLCQIFLKLYSGYQWKNHLFNMRVNDIFKSIPVHWCASRLPVKHMFSQLVGSLLQLPHRLTQ